MGLFDRLFGSKPATSAAEANTPTKQDNTYFLEPEAATSLGDVAYMKRSNTIRHTFPGTADSPGTKEMVAEVASMEARLDRVSEGLPGSETGQAGVNINTGVPKPVKKTFARQISQDELEQRMKGSAVGVNVLGGPAAIRAEKEQEPQTKAQSFSQDSGQEQKPGAIDPFKAMARDLRG